MNKRNRERSVLDQEPSAAILTWTSSSGAGTRMPAQGWLLGFRDPLIERAYLDAQHRRNRKYHAITLSVVTMLIASFIWTDPLLLPPDAIQAFRIARIYLLVPSSALLTINAAWIADPIAWIRQCAGLLLLFGLVHSLLILVAGVSVFQYLETGMLQVILGSFLLVGLPVRWSLSIASVFGLTFGASVLHVEADNAPFANFSVDFVIYTCIGVIGSYRYEHASRREFIAQLYSRKEYTERLAADTDRRRWLEVFAAFLRHELKNSITAISTSIEMADRVAPKSDASRYLDRGRRSVQYMHQLLTKVADATNLEAALALYEFEPIELSTLILATIDDCKKDHPHRQFATDIEPDVYVRGHGDSLIQMLEKLINNALEHGEPSHPIEITLQTRSMTCSFTVSDVGDALPDDTTQIFEPLVSKKAARAGVANLGLGLFVAKTIASNHGGIIWTEPLAEAVGARFTVQLPRLVLPDLRGNPSVPTAPLRPNAVEAGFNS